MKKLIAILTMAVFLAGLNFQAMAAGDDEKDKNEDNTTMTTSLNGQVVDINTGEALTGVKLKIKGEDVSAYTGFDGSFKLQGLKPGKYSVETSFISYKDKVENIALELNDKNKVTIQMESLEE
jgi:hypothetical protein